MQHKGQHLRKPERTRKVCAPPQRSLACQSLLNPMTLTSSILEPSILSRNVLQSSVLDGHCLSVIGKGKVEACLQESEALLQGCQLTAQPESQRALEFLQDMKRETHRSWRRSCPGGGAIIMEEGERKRPIIAARERGPGPGRYGLPPTIGYVGHDYTKPTSPAYSFHHRMSSKLYSVDSSPGPQYFIDAKLTRFGRDGTPSYSIQGRMRSSSGVFQTPGPGAYSPEAAPPLNSHRRPPSYTMGSRTSYRSTDTVPSPNKYTLPALLGSQVPTKPASASYSMSARRKPGSSTEDRAMTPGPGKYNSTNPNVYLPRRPAFSILGRYTVPSDATQKPGPGTHDAEKVMVHKPRPPSFSLGIRHSEFVTPLVVDMPDRA